LQVESREGIIKGLEKKSQHGPDLLLSREEREGLLSVQ
jgi:hypothetical protein